MGEIPQKDATFEATDYKGLYEESRENEFMLPAPDLDAAILTAAGDMHLINSEPSGDIASAHFGRAATTANYQTSTSEVRVVSEKDYLVALQEFLNDCLSAATDRDPNSPLVDKIKEFKEKLVYINNVEFQKATNVMAEKIISDAAQGMVVGIYSQNERSPQYVAVNVLTKVKRILESRSNYSQEEADEILNRIIFATHADELVDAVTEKDGSDDLHRRIYIIDDFVLSSLTIQGFIKDIESAISNQATGRPDADIEVRGLVVCTLPDMRVQYGESTIPIDTIFTANPPDYAMAGSWSETDYGYVDILYKFRDKLRLYHPADKTERFNGMHGIKGRYEKDESGKYLDSQYEEELEQVTKTFSPKD